jgi:hypothetical protein
VARRISTVTVLLTCLALLVSLFAAGTVAASKKDKKGGDGCTPGYWKQEQHFDSWAVPTSTLINTALETNIFPSGMTLLQALNAGGGDINALARHAAAAYLNAVSGDVDYGYTLAEIKEIIDDAPGDIEGAKNLLAAANEAGCPLN